jgi:small subunit ribosomal protein S7
MPRRKKIFKKQWTADPKHDNLLVGRFIGQILLDGKRTVAENVVYDAFDIIAERTGNGGLNVFEQAIKNVSPMVMLKSRRVGGANYQVPVPVTGERRQTLAMRWIREVCRKKKGSSMANRLADELIAAAEKEGAAMKKREETHRMAEANKAFAHFA